MNAVDVNSGNYIFKQAPLKYGDNQSYYLAEVSKIIKEAIASLKGVQDQKEIQNLFFSMLAIFGEERHRIAVATRTGNSEDFGIMRDSDQGIETPYNYTVLVERYNEYGNKMCQKLQNILIRMPHTLREFSNSVCKEESSCLGRKSSFEVEVLDGETLRKKQWNREPNPLEIFQIVGHKKGMRERLKELKRVAPTIYMHDKMHYFTAAMYNTFPSPKQVQAADGSIRLEGDTNNLKSHWVLSTSRLEIDGKMYALSSHLTYMYLNYQEDPVKRMTGRSKIVILHQDVFLIEQTLKEISKVFQSVLLWDAKQHSIPNLQDRVGLFRYMFAHCMPYMRGSAAIGEWFEQVLYNYHGYGIKADQTKACDLEALTALSLGDFMEEYRKITKILY